jgi:hypothetical protein
MLVTTSGLGGRNALASSGRSAPVGQNAIGMTTGEQIRHADHGYTPPLLQLA